MSTIYVVSSNPQCRTHCTCLFILLFSFNMHTFDITCVVYRENLRIRKLMYLLFSFLRVKNSVLFNTTLFSLSLSPSLSLGKKQQAAESRRFSLLRANLVIALHTLEPANAKQSVLLKNFFNINLPIAAIVSQTGCSKHHILTADACSVLISNKQHPPPSPLQKKKKKNRKKRGGMGGLIAQSVIESKSTG